MENGGSQASRRSFSSISGGHGRAWPIECIIQALMDLRCICFPFRSGWCLDGLLRTLAAIE